MRKLSLFILLLLCGQFLQAKQTIIKGHFQYAPDSMVELLYCANPLEYIDDVRTKLDAKVDADRNFTLRFDIDHPVMINLNNGFHSLFNNKYILPGDSIVFDFAKGKIAYEGNCEARFKIQFEMADRFSLSDRSYLQLGPVPFAEFWNERRLEQIVFFWHEGGKQHFPDAFIKAMESEINYYNAIHVLQFIMRHCKDDMRLGTQDPNFLGQFCLVKTNDTGALLSMQYVRYLREVPYSLWIGNIDRRNEETPEAKYYNNNQYRLRDSIAKRYFKGKVYDLALYSILREVALAPGYYMRTPRFDSMYDKYEKELQQYAGSFNDKSLYKRLENKLHSFKKERKAAPDFKLVDLNGKEVRLSDFKGKVVYIDFWATACEPCNTELPHIRKLQKHYNNSDLVMLFVSVDNDKKTLERHVKTSSFDGIHLYDVKNFASEIAKQYQVSDLPKYVLIDKLGRLVTDNAPRPSSHPETMIDAVLKEK